MVLPVSLLSCCADGRDVPDGSSVQFTQQLKDDLAAMEAENPGLDAKIASGGGRMQVTMDRYEVRECGGLGGGLGAQAGSLGSDVSVQPSAAGCSSNGCEERQRTPCMQEVPKRRQCSALVFWQVRLPGSCGSLWRCAYMTSCCRPTGTL